MYTSEKSEHTLLGLRETTISDREKLIQYISKLTNEEVEAFIAFLKTVPSSEEVSMPLHPSNSLQKQEVAV